MSGIRKRTADITLANGGTGEDDIRVKSEVTPSRFAGLFAVKVTHTEVKGGFSVTLYELNDIDDDDELTYGDVLFHIPDPASGQMYFPRVVSVDEGGVSSAEENVLPSIDTAQVRVAAQGGTDAGVIVVDVYNQSAGDQRF